MNNLQEIVITPGAFIYRNHMGTYAAQAEFESEIRKVLTPGKSLSSMCDNNSYGKRLDKTALLFKNMKKFKPGSVIMLNFLDTYVSEIFHTQPLTELVDALAKKLGITIIIVSRGPKEERYFFRKHTPNRYIIAS